MTSSNVGPARARRAPMHELVTAGLAGFGRVTAGAVVGIAVLATLAACGGGKSGASTQSTPSPAAATGAGGAAGQRTPGVSGIVADVASGQLEVQDPTSGQTTVTYASTTTFTQQKLLTEASVTAGACVTAVAASTGSGTASSAPASTPAGGSPVNITATTVTVTQPVNGVCGAFGGGTAGGTRPSNLPTGARPSNVPSGARRSGAAGTAGFGGLVTGKVSAVSGSVIDVQATDRQTNTTVARTVTVTSATKYLETVAATSAAVQVGVCVNAIGPADSTGAVAATRISVTQPVNGSCSTGFGGFGGRGGFGRPGAGATTSG